MDGKIGFKIKGDFQRSSKELIEAFKNLGSCAVSDGLNKFNTVHHSLKPILDDTVICGNALTVKMRPGDNLMLHKAIGIAKPGDVIVVDTCGSETNSVMGELMAMAAFKSGVEGIVVDGAIRDIRELKKHGFPVFAKCVTPAVGDKEGPGVINDVICCGGVAVLPGDIILGDANGIVVIHQEEAIDILKQAEEKLSKDEKRMEEILKGVITKPDIDRILRDKGVI
ncbi:RraA family protein [Alloiococcus sp. CFN-8]|uniref:RraA family protein n=1 Tax=Alloiococcus sp. CFN-8 TaxID=3416081 RepID=UPI003CFB192C